jgi:NAD(P)H-dependent flavin oxidoreductase YrpB (nitropropane dioxygenase family)
LRLPTSSSRRSGPAVGAVDGLLEVGDEVGADLLVAVGLVGVVADHERWGAGAVVDVPLAAGGHRGGGLDPQVFGDGAVAAGAAQQAAA